MLNVHFLLFFEFLKVGLFTFGGGYASLPFLYAIIDNYSWYSAKQLTQLIAISGITPGPIGLNMATFAGYETLGIKGAFISSIALVVPMLFITSFVFRLYKKFSENKYVESILYVLRPTSCALILWVGAKLFINLVLKSNSNAIDIDYFALFLVVFLFLLTFKLKRDPIIYMAIAGIFGVLLSYFKFL